jgi:HEAT repeat protein
LAGAVKPELQERTVGLVVELEIPQLLKIELLGVTRSCNSIPTIRQALEEKDWIIRWIATRALGTIGSEATVPALAQAVNDEESSVRLQAIEALEKVGTEVIVPALSQAVNDEEPSVRLQVVNALETVGNDSAIYNLLNAWTDENPEIRFRTLSVLGQITGKDKISTLVQYLTERGFKVQSTLYSSYLRDEIFSWSRQKPQPIAYVYSPLDALEKIGESPTIHTLCQALVDENPSVRRSAVYRLKQFDSELTIPLLLQALQDEDSHVCLNAFSALKEIAVPGVLPYLYERILIATSPNFLDELFGVTSAIQQRCKFYNYTIATSPPPQDESKVEHLAAPIDMQQYEEILSVISNMVTVMERNPKTFAGIKKRLLEITS